MGIGYKQEIYRKTPEQSERKNGKIFNFPANRKNENQNHTKKPLHTHPRLAEIYRILIISTIIKTVEDGKIYTLPAGCGMHAAALENTMVIPEKVKVWTELTQQVPIWIRILKKF